MPKARTIRAGSPPQGRWNRAVNDCRRQILLDSCRQSANGCARARRRLPWQFAVCADSEGCEASLKRNKFYVVLPDKGAERDGDLHVVDESGEGGEGGASYRCGSCVGITPTKVYGQGSEQPTRAD